jgi:phosphatidylinositol alpha-mannosyltransferase
VRVALVCPYSWTVPGGVQNHVAGLRRELIRRGHRADVLAPSDGPAPPWLLPLGRSVPIPDNGSVQRVALSPTAVARTGRLLRRGGYDVVHVHEPLLPAPCLTALALRPAPLVGTFHMTARSPRWYRAFGPLCRRALARLDVRVAVSEEARRYVAASCPGDYAVVPNGVPVAGAPRARTEASPPRILFVGRPEPRKGLPVLLEAFAELRGRAELHLVGPDGELGARVRAHGRVDDARRDALLASAAVLCAPSRAAESFGVVLVEAMAAGVPVVASDLPGYRAVLPPACGILVPPGDARALAAALARVLDDEPLRARMREAGPPAAARYDWSRVGEEILALYERAVAA